MPKIFKDMIQHGAAGGVLLVFAAAIAMILANTPLSPFYSGILSLQVTISAGSFEIAKPLLLWINDGLMALFFFYIGLEIKREVVEGHLSSPDQILLPGIAALAGIVVPAIFYGLFNSYEPTGLKGWAIPSATDIAFALGVFSIFGARLPVSLKLFLLSVAIFDDLGAIVIIALFYSQDLSAVSMGVALTGLAILYLMNRARVPYVAMYVVVGTVVWAAVLKSGVHATLAGFAVALLIPLGVKNSDGHSLNRNMEHGLQPWVAFFILPIFAFANSGVSFIGLSHEAMFNSVTLGIAVGLFLGKQIGIFGATWLAVKSGIAKLPSGANWMQIYGISCLCGIGFTMSLFIGSLAFELDPQSYQNSVKIGVLFGSLCSALLAALVISKSQKSSDIREHRSLPMKSYSVRRLHLRARLKLRLNRRVQPQN